MESNKLIIGIVIAVVIAIAVIVAIFMGSTVLSQQNHNSFCSNWNDDLNQQHNQLQNQSFISTFQAEQYNNELADYKKECQY